MLARVKRAVREHAALALGVGIAVLVACWQTHGVWGARPPAGEDVSSHLVRLDFAIPQLLAHGRLDGWLPRFYAGYEEFLFNGPGLAWAVGLVRVFTFGALSNSGALKVVAVGSYVALPLAMAFLARSLGFSEATAGVAAILTLLVNNLFGVGLSGVFVIGLVSQQLGALAWCVALGAFVRIPVDRRVRWMVIGGAALAALLITHLISAMVLVLVAGLFLLVRAGRRELGPGAIGRLALAGALALGLSAWWLVPAIAHRDLRGTVATWATPSLPHRIHQIFAGDLLFSKGTAAIVALAWLWGIVRIARRRPLAAAVIGVPIVYLVVAHLAYRRWPTNEIAVQLSNRGIGYLGLLAILPLASALATAGAWVGRQFDRQLIGTCAALGVATVLVLSVFGPKTEVATQLSEPIPAMRDAARELRRLVPDGARFATERDYPAEIERVGVIHPEFWLARVSGRNSLNGFNLEATSTPWVTFEPNKLREVEPDAAADALARLGVTHVVTTTESTADRLSSSPRWRSVFSADPIDIFEIAPTEGRALPGTLIDGTVGAKLVEPAPEHLVWKFDAPEAADVDVAVAWSPKWHGRLDGEPIAVERTADGLITLDIPRGEHELTLTYRSDGWDRVGVIVTLVTLVILAVWFVRRRYSTSSNFSRIA